MTRIAVKNQYVIVVVVHLDQTELLGHARCHTLHYLVCLLNNTVSNLGGRDQIKRPYLDRGP